MAELKNDKKKTDWLELFLQYRMRISLFIVLAGMALFLMQMNTTGRTARPDQAFSLLMVRDFSAYNEYRKSLTGDSEMDPAQAPRVNTHYEGNSLPGFQDRFSTFVESLPETTGISLIPVHLRFSPVTSSRLQIPVSYLLLQMKPDDARMMLADVVDISTIESGNQYLGPSPYSVPPSAEQLQANSKQTLQQTPVLLDSSASALQGAVIQVVDEVQPNAFGIIAAGNTNVGDYAVAVNEFSQKLSKPYMEQVRNNTYPDIIPSFSFSDIRHDTLTYIFVTLGQLLVMAGGFLFCYHLIEKYGEKEHAKMNPLKKLIVDTCQLVSHHHRLYAMTIAFFMLFWVFGMFNAHFNPAAQEEMITTFQTMFSGSSWPLGFTAQAYARGDILTSAVMTFLVNFFWGTLVVLTLFSVIPIGSAFIINALRGQTIGMVLAPTKAFAGMAMVPHLITMVLELQGYLLAGFVAVLLPLALIRPQKFGCDSALEAFKKYVMWQFKVLPLIAISLAIAAIYEAIELIVLGNLF